jgi:hypothetical protein
MPFTVTNIIDGNTIQVAGWKWGDFRGTKVKIAGYSFNGKDSNYNSFAKNRLEKLILGKEIELLNVVKAEKGIGVKDDIIYCSVLFNGVNIAQYFPELRTSV